MKRIVHDVKNNIKYEQECGKEIKSFSIAIANTYHIFHNFINDIYLINSVDEFNFFKEDDPANHISDSPKKFFEFIKENATCAINVTDNACIVYTKSGAIITITVGKSLTYSDIVELNASIQNISYETAVAIEQQLSIVFTVKVEPEYKETTKIDLTKIKVEAPEDTTERKVGYRQYEYENKHLLAKKSYSDILSLKEGLLYSINGITSLDHDMSQAIKDCLVRDICADSKHDFKEEDYEKYNIVYCELLDVFDTKGNRSGINLTIIFNKDADSKIMLSITKHNNNKYDVEIMSNALVGYMVGDYNNLCYDIVQDDYVALLECGFELSLRDGRIE